MTEGNARGATVCRRIFALKYEKYICNPSISDSVNTP